MAGERVKIVASERTKLGSAESRRLRRQGLIPGVLYGRATPVPIDPRFKPENMTVLSISGLLAETIMNVFADDSVSAIFGGDTQLF